MSDLAQVFLLGGFIGLVLGSALTGFLFTIERTLSPH
jgi:hypothetical protein